MVVEFRECLVAVNFCLQQSKQLFKKLDSICQSYAQMKKGPVFSDSQSTSH